MSHCGGIPHPSFRRSPRGFLCSWSAALLQPPPQAVCRSRLSLWEGKGGSPLPGCSGHSLRNLPGLFPGSAAGLSTSQEQRETRLGWIDSPDRVQAVAETLRVYSLLTRCNQAAQDHNGFWNFTSILKTISPR